MLSKKKMRIVLVVIAIVMIALIGGNRMSIIKEVGQIRESIAQKFPSEEEKRRRIGGYDRGPVFFRRGTGSVSGGR